MISTTKIARRLTAKLAPVDFLGSRLIVQRAQITDQLVD